jgi:hypothetical protein
MDPGHMLHRLFVFLVVALTSGCTLLGGARVEAVATSVEKPSNVALLVEVNEGDDPVTGLATENFRIYENEQLLSESEVKRALLDRTPVTAERVLLLVELHGAPSSPERARVVRAVEVFVEKIRPSVAVSVFAYDGSDSLKLVGEYERGAGPAVASAIATAPGPDGSRNLHGAVLDGVRQLELRLASEGKPVRLGTIVVVARGPDLANRTTEDKMLQVLDAVNFNVIGVGIGEDTPYLYFARGGIVRAQSADTLPIALEEAGARVVATQAKYYLVSYCSPARAGQRRVKIEVAYTTKTGDERGGSTTHDFDATGFGPGCSPETMPRFAPQKAVPAAAPTSPASGTAPPGTVPAADPAGAPVTPAPPAQTPPGEVVTPPAKTESPK